MQRLCSERQRRRQHCGGGGGGEQRSAASTRPTQPAAVRCRACGSAGVQRRRVHDVERHAGGPAGRGWGDWGSELGSPGSPLRNKVVGQAAPQPGGCGDHSSHLLRTYAGPKASEDSEGCLAGPRREAKGAVAAQHAAQHGSPRRPTVPPGASARSLQATKLPAAAPGARHRSTTTRQQQGGALAGCPAGAVCCCRA